MSHSKIKVRIREAERSFIRLFGGRSNRDFEYDFAYRNILGQKLTILDIGACGSLLPFMLAKSGHRVTVYDFRDYRESHSNLSIVKGDFLDNKLPDNSFDSVILISTIEHVGLGSYDAPFHKNGDLEVMSEVKRVLRQDGRAILTFPFTERHTILEDFERWYDIDRVKQLFQDMYVLKEEYWVPQIKILGRWVKWRPGILREAQTSFKDYGVQSTACFVVAADIPKPIEGLPLGVLISSQVLG